MSWSASELEMVAVMAARRAAGLVAERWGTATSIGTKSSATDVVTQTDVDAETMIRELLRTATPGCGIIGEERGAGDQREPLQWIVDPLDGTVNFLYGLPVVAVSVAAAWEGEFVAGAVVDVLRGETFSAAKGHGARCDGAQIGISGCADLPSALIATGFSYTPRLRAMQGEIMGRLLPAARDIRCFGSAALQLCWVACGRLDGYFERDIKLWDWAAGALIAAEAGAEVEYPCPENIGLVLATGPQLFSVLRAATNVGGPAADPRSRSV